MSARMVGRLLNEAGYSLQANSKTLEGSQHPDRDAQFRYINDPVQRPGRRGPGDQRRHQEEGTRRPATRTAAANCARTGDPQRSNVHDFVDEELGKALPTGSTTWPPTPAGSRRHRPRHRRVRGANDPPLVAPDGRTALPGRDELLITADCGGSNGYRLRACGRSSSPAFADELPDSITVCHLPPGTSKWNRIEHRLFSHITTNWRGKPLTPTRSSSA